MKTIIVLSSSMEPPVCPRGFDRHAWPAQVVPLMEAVEGPILVVSYPPFMRAAQGVRQAILEAGSLADRSNKVRIAYDAWMDLHVDPLLTHKALVQDYAVSQRLPMRVAGATLSPSMFEHACLRLLALYHARLSARLRSELSLNGRFEVELGTGVVVWRDKSRSQPWTRPLLVSGSEAVPSGLEPVGPGSYEAYTSHPRALVLPPEDWSVAVAATRTFPKAEVIYVGYDRELPPAFERMLLPGLQARAHVLRW